MVALVFAISTISIWECWQDSWRLLQNPASLCCTVLKALYFPDASILEAKPKQGMLYMWKSILRGLDLLKEGIVWRVGSGKEIDVWQDPWIPRRSTRRVQMPNEMDDTY
jgi:hypothetical protein